MSSLSIGSPLRARLDHRLGHVGLLDEAVTQRDLEEAGSERFDDRLDRRPATTGTSCVTTVSSTTLACSTLLCRRL